MARRAAEPDPPGTVVRCLGPGCTVDLAKLPPMLSTGKPPTVCCSIRCLQRWQAEYGTAASGRPRRVAADG